MSDSTFFRMALALAVGLLPGAAAGLRGETPSMTETELFAAGHGPYASYRIPALIATSRGTLLAFAEGRRDGRGDTGKIDTLLRRSMDGGHSWEPFAVVASDGENTVGNPCPVVDRKTGRVHLLLTHNHGADHERDILAGTAAHGRRVLALHSDDEGASWSEPRDITGQVKHPAWRWYATGPGVGLQLRDGTLVIPANHSDHRLHEEEGRTDQSFYRAHLFFSRDGGENWQLGGVAGDNTNESQVVELMDGRLMMNMRSYHGRNRRAVATSADGGMTWSDIHLDPVLIEPVCQAGFLRYSGFGEGEVSRLIFTNPAHETRRRNLTVRLSYDEGKTWPVAKLLTEDFASYSSPAVLPNGDIGVFYEKGFRVERLTLARFSLDWLEEGAGPRREVK